MRYYLVMVKKLGNRFIYPDVGHKDYGNCGYSPDFSQCIWAADDTISMNAPGLQELDETEAVAKLAEWKAARETK